MFSYFPDEIMIEILKSLPVKSLLLFSSVCKTWNSIIKNPSFISKHLHYAANSRKHLICITPEDLFFFFDGGGLLLENSILEYPVSTRDPYGVSFHGSCNGLLCFSIDERLKASQIYIWNPATGDLLQLPTPLLRGSHASGILGSCVAFGFVNNNSNNNSGSVGGIDEYKVVRFRDFQPHDEFCYCKVKPEVYSSRTKSWKKLRRTVAILQSEYMLFTPTVMNGIVYWPVLFEDELRPNMILAFDLRSEKFREIKFPNGAAADKDFNKDWFTTSTSMDKCGESLSLVLGRFDDIDSGILHIWVFSDFNKGQIWTQKYTIEGLNIEKPIGFQHNGEVLLLAKERKRDSIKLLSYNLVTQKCGVLTGLKLNSVCGSTDILQNYVETLLPANLQY